MSEQTIERKGSSTAGYTCFSRACATREQNERFRGPDDLAEIFLPPLAQILLNVAFLRKWFMRKMFPAGIYEYVLARTHLFDEIFVDALDNGFAQIVILGAGMDTRALRFQDRNSGTTIFELDIEPTQHYKREVYSRKKTALPEKLVFVPIDFNKQQISDVLSEAGYQRGHKTLFLWEGVTMYLEPRAVDATLAFVRSSAAQGSTIVFDYVRGSVLRRENTLYGERGIFDTVARAGEGWTFGIDEDAIETFLTERGFEMLAHYTPSDLEAAYLVNGDGSSLGCINETHCIVIAGIQTL